MSGFVAVGKDIIVVGFRGTDMYSPRDWLANVDFLFQTSMDDGRYFHGGFQDSYALFADQIKNVLRGRSVKQIWITGHSLGGALATCCAYDWLRSGIPMTGLVTFGQPRVANPAMARYLDEQIGDRTLRFRNGNDIVPTVPPRKFFRVKYQHTRREAWYVDGEVERDLLKAAIVAARDDDDLFGDAPAEPARKAAEAEVTDKELIELQEFLRQTQPIEVVASLPDTLKSRNNLNARAPMQGAPASLSLTAPATLRARSMTSRFSDHSSLEYVRILNDMASDYFDLFGGNTKAGTDKK